MRTPTMAPGLAAAAAATLLAIAPASAGARHLGRNREGLPGAGGSCRLTLNAAPRFVQTGESTSLFGELKCSGGESAAGQTITVLERAAAGGVSSAGTATTEGSGHYQLTSPALSSNTTFYASTSTTRSVTRKVIVAPKVTVNGPADGSQLFTGGGPFIGLGHDRAGARLSNRVTFSGTVSPTLRGDAVVLQRENATGNEEWHRIGLGAVGAGGEYSIPHVFAVPGDANIRVVVRGTRSTGRAASDTLSYEISQAENPALTITSSADPITSGSPVTISGTVLAAAGAHLTLMARTHPSLSFLPVASAVSGPGGAYTFAAQSPQQSTTYRVVGDGRTSAGLFEGARYTLTTTTPPSSVPAGTPLSFSGTVSPVHAGHPVYLEAQFASGIGFHVIQVGTVAADGSYSITHVPFLPGSFKLRVKVPGDPGNQGAASQLFAITVTAPPASALTPEPPNNSRQPLEGQL